MKDYAVFLWRCFRLSFKGDKYYQWWMLFLTVITLIGLNAYCRQFTDGLITTGMTDQVSWGMYIANFTFLVGMAAAAVMLVIPVYIYRNKELHEFGLSLGVPHGKKIFGINVRRVRVGYKKGGEFQGWTFGTEFPF